MTLLGGVQTVIGPLVGAAAFHSIRDFVMLGGVQHAIASLVGPAAFQIVRDYVVPLADQWRLLLGLAIIAIVLAFPRGIVGGLIDLRARFARGRTGGAPT
jgi:ABC-type branched-subunit amino acid transport system permease subunit